MTANTSTRSRPVTLSTPLCSHQTDTGYAQLLQAASRSLTWRASTCPTHPIHKQFVSYMFQGLLLTNSSLSVLILPRLGNQNVCQLHGHRMVKLCLADSLMISSECGVSCRSMFVEMFNYYCNFSTSKMWTLIRCFRVS
jgi:hypothetical protein